MTFDQSLRECSIIANEEISFETIVDRFSFCREVCMITFDEVFEEEGKIANDGEIIEIDECKIGRQKYEDA